MAIPRVLFVVRLVVAWPTLLKPWLVWIAPAGMKLVIPPTVVEVTFTVTVHDALAAKVAPASPTDVAPGVALTTPEGQVVEATGVDAITIPLGAAPMVPSTVKWSVKPRPEAAAEPLLTVIVSWLA